MGLPDAFLKAMIWWAVLIGVALSEWFLVSSVGEIHSHAEVDANGAFCTQLISTMGYPCEEHQAVTADGFVLAVHRIPYGAMGKQITPTRQPVFLQHGFMGGGDQWVLDSPQQSLAFILADSGFDVWIGNLRCNRWSTGHAFLTTQDKKYWEWSWDEHATFDVPAMLQLVFNQTGSRAKYIGHSQGTIIFLAALSQSSVTQFVDGAALLSPIAYLSQVTSILAKTFATIFVDKVYLGLGVKEFDASSGLGKRLLQLYCSLRVSDCVNLITELSGPNCCVDFSRMPFYTLYEPQSTSVKNIAHLLQMIRTGKFNKFDYGAVGNLQHYGQLQPPNYNLSRISQDFSMLLAYGGEDALADESDVQYLVSKLPCHPRILHLPQYAHADFVLGTSANKDLYEPIINYFLGK